MISKIVVSYKGQTSEVMILFCCKYMLLEQVFDLTEKSFKLSDWLNWKGQLQQVARNRAVFQNERQLYATFESCMRHVASRYTLEDLLLQQSR